MCVMASLAHAGTISVNLRDQNIHYTLYTLDDGAVEFVHLSKIADIFQLTEEIDPVDGRVVVGAGEKYASFFPGQQAIIADRRSYFLDIPPREVEGVIMVPLSFVTDILPLLVNADVVWDPNTRTIEVGVQNLELFNVYASPYGEYTRIVVELNQVIAYTVTEKLPSLLIFELPQAQLSLPENPLQIDNPAVKQVKVIDSFGTTQIIVRLGTEFARYSHEIINEPPQLVIDVYTTQNNVEMAPTPQSPEIVEQNISQEPQPPSADSRPSSIQTVVIDPGHGGSDDGISMSPAAEGKSAVTEKDITLNVAKKLAADLKQRLGIRVILTREGDDFISSEERATVANGNRAGVFVSLHVNTDQAPARSGFEVYIMDYGSLDLPQGSALSQELDFAQAKYIGQSQQLAQQIVAAYAARKNSGRSVLKKAPLFTLKGTTMPAVQIELGYASNGADRGNLTQEAFQQTLADAIADGIAAFKKDTAP